MLDKKRPKKRLKAIHVNRELERKLKKEILLQIYTIIFSPILKLVEAENVDLVLNNSQYSALTTALMKGRISYVQDHFIGDFNAAISADLQKLGAVRIKTGWHIKRENLPQPINIILANAESKFIQLGTKISETLSFAKLQKLSAKITDLFATQYYQELNRLDRQIDKNTRNSVAIEAEVTPALKERIAKEFALNIEKYVQDFTGQEIIKMRELVQENVLKGGRATDLKKILIQRFGITERKAEFLAKQETSLMTSAYTFGRYQDLGITKYEWLTSGKENVRHDHKILNGKEFNFANPPITNQKTGARNNPGEDYGCECVAAPIVE